jgi:hypothetical protein
VTPAARDRSHAPNCPNQAAPAPLKNREGHFSYPYPPTAPPTGLMIWFDQNEALPKSLSKKASVIALTKPPTAPPSDVQTTAIGRLRIGRPS